uniref:Transposase-associated domain-containing protein n=1 Tax=Chenopodium quinoa TaxID=63459 RepID=A0A803MQZ2_CHEQI
MDTSNLLIRKRLEWMGCDDKTHTLYINGVTEFLDFAFTDQSSSIDDEEEETKVPCPCNRCNNSRHNTREEIYDDLLLNGMVKGYVRWIYHGEFKPQEKRRRIEIGDDKGQDEIFDMIYEAHGPMSSNDILDELNNQPKEGEPDDNEHVKGTKGVESFENLMRDA